MAALEAAVLGETALPGLPLDRWLRGEPAPSLAASKNTAWEESWEDCADPPAWGETAIDAPTRPPSSAVAESRTRVGATFGLDTLGGALEHPRVLPRCWHPRLFPFREPSVTFAVRNRVECRH